MKDERRQTFTSTYAIHAGSKRNRRREGDDEITQVTRLYEKVGDQLNAADENLDKTAEVADETVARMSVLPPAPEKDGEEGGGNG